MPLFLHAFPCPLLIRGMMGTQRGWDRAGEALRRVLQGAAWVGRGWIPVAKANQAEKDEGVWARAWHRQRLEVMEK